MLPACYLFHHLRWKGANSMAGIYFQYIDWLDNDDETHRNERWENIVYDGMLDTEHNKSDRKQILYKFHIDCHSRLYKRKAAENSIIIIFVFLCLILKHKLNALNARSFERMLFFFFAFFFIFFPVLSKISIIMACDDRIFHFGFFLFFLHCVRGGMWLNRYLSR